MVTLASGSHGVHISSSSWKHFPNHLSVSLGEDPESHPVDQSNFPLCYKPSKKELPVSCIHRLLSLFPAKKKTTCDVLIHGYQPPTPTSD